MKNKGERKIGWLDLWAWFGRCRGLGISICGLVGSIRAEGGGGVGGAARTSTISLGKTKEREKDCENGGLGFLSAASFRRNEGGQEEAWVAGLRWKRKGGGLGGWRKSRGSMMTRIQNVYTSALLDLHHHKYQQF
ncbi:hypothetical protein BVRB_8g196590 [Beta vulgaris subsp. vulgaris]|nr:hypothetical protein BVRB_8g196590 [Beta vulgaris subsp. vulgaris]